MSAAAWGESTWNNNNGFGGILEANVTVTGLSATSSVGTVSISESVAITLTGVSALIVLVA